MQMNKQLEVEKTEFLNMIDCIKKIKFVIYG